MNADFELRGQLIFGQYLPTGSVLHRLDPRARLVAFGLLALALMFGDVFLSIRTVWFRPWRF